MDSRQNNKRAKRFARNKKRWEKDQKGKKSSEPFAEKISIWKDTQWLCRKIWKTDRLDGSILYDIDNLGQIIGHVPEDLPTYPVVIEIVDIDTLLMAADFVADGLNPLVLNMASCFKPGGGVRSGKTAQEEEIFRRTNAWLTHYYEWYQNEEIRKGRLDDNEVVFSPEVTVVKDENNKVLDEPFSFGMLAVPAIRKPRTDRNGDYRYESDCDTMYYKIEAIFKIAIAHGHDSLILGALGCGAYGNPVHQVVAMFKEHCDKYGKYFKKIGFGIKICKPKDQINLDSFQEAFA